MLWVPGVAFIGPEPGLSLFSHLRSLKQVMASESEPIPK